MNQSLFEYPETMSFVSGSDGYQSMLPVKSEASAHSPMRQPNMFVSCLHQMLSVKLQYNDDLLNLLLCL